MNHSIYKVSLTFFLGDESYSKERFFLLPINVKGSEALKLISGLGIDAGCRASTINVEFIGYGEIPAEKERMR